MSLSLENPCTFFLVKEKTWKRIYSSNSELLKNCTEKNYVIQNCNKLAIQLCMILFIDCLFWMKIWHFSTNSCLGFIISLRYFYFTFLLAKVGLLMHSWVFLNNNLLIISRTVEVKVLIRFVSNNILFRFFTGMDSGGLLNFFTNFYYSLKILENF